MGEDRYSYGYKYKIEPIVGTAIFVATIAGFALIIYLLEPYPTVIPRVSTLNNIFNINDYKLVVEVMKYFNNIFTNICFRWRDSFRGRV